MSPASRLVRLILATAATSVLACAPASEGDATDAGVDAGVDAGKADAGRPDAGRVDAGGVDAGPESCEAETAAYVVDGTCSNGGRSIAFACLRAKGCDVSWIADFRVWSGTLEGDTYSLASANGGETITGTLESDGHTTYSYAAGSLTCEASATPISPGAASSLCCDVLAQDCADGEACTLVWVDGADGPEETTACFPLATDAAAKGDACTSAFGEAACERGASCVTLPDGSGPTCYALCVGSGDCDDGEICLVAAYAPRAGICVKPCVPFAEGSCAGDLACRPAVASNAQFVREMNGYCTEAGAGGPGSECALSADCGATEVCWAGTCATACDDAHPCATGACETYGLGLAEGVGAGLGACL